MCRHLLGGAVAQIAKITNKGIRFVLPLVDELAVVSNAHVNSFNSIIVSMKARTFIRLL